MNLCIFSILVSCYVIQISYEKPPASPKLPPKRHSRCAVGGGSQEGENNIYHGGHHPHRISHHGPHRKGNEFSEGNDNNEIPLYDVVNTHNHNEHGQCSCMDKNKSPDYDYVKPHSHHGNGPCSCMERNTDGGYDTLRAHSPGPNGGCSCAEHHGNGIYDIPRPRPTPRKKCSCPLSNQDHIYCMHGPSEESSEENEESNNLPMEKSTKPPLPIRRIGLEPECTCPPGKHSRKCKVYLESGGQKGRKLQRGRGSFRFTCLMGSPTDD